MLDGHLKIVPQSNIGEFLLRSRRTLNHQRMTIRIGSNVLDCRYGNAVSQKVLVLGIEDHAHRTLDDLGGIFWGLSHLGSILSIEGASSNSGAVQTSNQRGGSIKQAEFFNRIDWIRPHVSSTGFVYRSHLTADACLPAKIS
jgi:hypothetical protein